MKLRTIYSSIILLLVATISVAQTPTKVYRTKDGRLYSSIQRDSLAKAGHPIGEIGLTTVGDTTFINIQINPKEDLSGNAFAQRYKDKKLPPFQLKTLDGKIINSESLQGKVVMINFWSTTCGPCLKEMPELNQLKNKFKNVVFLAPAPENAATIKKLLQKHPFKFVILPDAEKMFKEWGIEGYPKNFFVDQKGIIREVKEGTPLSRETKNDKWVIAVEKTYSPIINGLVEKIKENSR
jgi:thiol-disulfide isomerase/thioredoxin